MHHVIPTLAALVGFLSATAASESWPQFRGPEGTGHANASGLPLSWSETENVTWKTAIHDRGWSSPVILDGQIWITAAPQDGHKLYAICVEAASGRIVHDLKLFDVAEPQFCHKFNTYASPTPVLEPGRAYITFGSPGTACLDSATGKVLWERRDLECNHFRAAGSSPILYKDLLILHYDGSDHQYLVALDKNTGKTVWRTGRSVDFKDLTPEGKIKMEGDLRKAYATPHVVSIDGADQLISLGAMAAYGYDPMSGNELWRVVERGQHSASTRPVFGAGLILYPTGFARGQLYAVRPGGKGDITQTHVAWKSKRSVPNKPSILFVEGLIFMVDDGGVASCMDAKTGEMIWNERVGGNYSASPLYADGKVYFFSEEGKTTIVRASREFEVLKVNQLDDGFMSSPAVTENALILRTRKALYRIETGDAK